MARRVFIFGASGMLGFMSADYLGFRGHQVVPVRREGFDIGRDSLDDWAAQVSLSAGDVVINAAALTNRHLSEASEQELIAVNATFPKALDKLVALRRAILIQVSTESVFNGKQGGYWESCQPDPVDAYGQSKLAGEDLPNAIVIRMSPVGIEQEHHYNLLSWVFSQAGKTVHGFTNHTWNGISTLAFAKIVDEFLRQGFPETGLYHVHSKRVVTKYELVEMAARIFATSLSLQLHQTPEPVLRHLASEKDLSKALALPDIEEQLIEMRTYCESRNIPWKSS